jgi:hypothetical protein
LERKREESREASDRWIGDLDLGKEPENLGIWDL